MTETPRLQFHIAGTLHHPDGGDWSKRRWEVEASWRTPLGPGRYRIWHEQSWRGSYYRVVRLKPSTGISKLTNSALKFSGHSLADVVHDMEKAVAIAEADTRVSPMEARHEVREACHA
jgi:hypothetical protein